MKKLFSKKDKHSSKLTKANSPSDIISGQVFKRMANQPSRAALIIVALFGGIIGGYFIYQSFAAETAQVTVTINRAAPNGTSNWVPAHTSVSNEFYSPWGQNQGPDTTPGTAQYNARELEKEGIVQHNVHIMAWARSSPWLNEADGTPDPNLAYNTGRWGGQGMDQEIKRAADKGLQPTITLAMAPGWMVGKRTSGNGIVTPIPDYDTAAGFYQARVTTDKMDKWLQLVDSIVKRYSKPPYNVRTYDIWNEFKGYYNPDTNNYDAGTYCGTPGKADMGYTCFYNKTRAQILASAASVGVTSGIRTGGPYVVSDIWDQSGAGGYPVTDGRGSVNNVLSGAKSYGWVDGRSLDAIKTWLANKSGAEFIALRFSNQTRADTILGSDWDSLKFAGDLATWVRGLPESIYPGASTLPFWNAEHYTTPNVDATVGAKQAAFSAESYRIGIRTGYEAMLRWGADGLDGLDLWTTTSVTNNHELRAGNGMPGNGHEVQKLFKQYFSKGTALYQETVSNPQQVSALASATHTLLINKTNTQLTVSVNGAFATLPPYGVTVIPAEGTAPPPPPPPSFSLKLINADTDQVIANMTNGMTIDLATARNLNIDASTTAVIESVRFDYDNQAGYKVESSPPYAIAGDNGGTDYYAWTPTVGTHTLTAKAFSADGAAGSELASTTVSFTVKDSSTTTNPTGWDLLYQDDFNTLNTSSTSPTAWQLYSGSGHAGNGLRQPSAISAANGILTITAKNVDSDGNGTLDKVSSGGMSNKTNMTYGKYETRVRTDIDPSGIMSGVMLTWPQTGSNWANGENDYYETLHAVNTRTPFKSFIHYPDTPENTSPTPQKEFVWNSDGSQWHRVVMEWTAEYINIKVYKSPEGGPETLVGDQTYLESTDPNRNNIPDVPHHPTIQLDAFSTALLNQPVLMQVDYIRVYKQSSTTTDSPPTVSITNPANNAPVAGTVNVTASASDDKGAVSGVQFKVDGQNVGTEDQIAPYTYSLNTASLPNGTHTISAVARDSANQTTTATITVSVFNSDTAAPNPPSTLCGTTTQPTNTTTGKVVLAWPAATDNGNPASGIKHYLVQRNGTTIATVTPAAAATCNNISYQFSYTDSNVPTGTYSYVIRSVDNALIASTTASPPYGTTIEQPTTPTDTTAPTTPANLATNPVSKFQINLSWAASSDAGGSGLAGYNVYMGTSASTVTTKLNSTLVTTTSFGSTGLKGGVTYYYQVEAVDGAGNKSSRTSIASATTPKTKFIRMLSRHGTHFYTTNEAERDFAVNALGFREEGIAGYVAMGDTSGYTPLYRLRNPHNGAHFYTTNTSERDYAVNNLRFQAEGIASYVSTAQRTGLTPLFRLLNPHNGAHFYTTNTSERDYAAANLGFRAEGITGYVGIGA